MSITYNGKSVLAIYRNGTAVEQALIAWNWTPRQLYFGGVRGAAYVPDASTVYGPGAEAVFGAGISTILDEKNGPPVIGPELVVNGEFTNGISGWTIATGSAVAIGGELAITSENNVGRATQIVPVVVGKRYIVKATIRYGTSTGRFRVGTTEQGLQYNSYTDSFVSIFTAITNQMYLGPQNGGSIGISYYSNISVREISENPATQTGASLRPLLGRSPLVKRNIISAGTHNFSAFIDEVNSEIIANNVMGPDDNPTSASSFQVDNVGGTGQCRWYSGVNFLSVGTFTYSIWLKKGTERYVALSTTGLDSPTSDNLATTIFDLENGVISSDGEGTGKIVPYTNGWYRCSASFTIAGTDVIGDIRLAVANQLSNNKTINLDGSIVFYGYGYQVERGSTATTYQKVISSLDITEDGVTSYPFIRMDLSDDALTTTGLGSTKNLLRYTEEFDNAVWTKASGWAVSGTQFLAPDGTMTADAIIPTAGTSLPYTVRTITVSAVTNTTTFYIKAGNAGVQWVRFVDANHTNGTAWFDIANGQTGTKQAGVTTTNITPAANGFWRIEITLTKSNTSFEWALAYASANGDAATTKTWNGTEIAFYLWGAQLEASSTATAYEYGGFKGTALVAGRNGTAVESVTLPDGNFTLGPTGVTSGTPGLLRAVGDIVGYNLINKTLTAKERKYLIEYYKDRGAKGMLVPGPELILNGNFAAGSENWSVGKGSVDFSTGAAVFAAGTDTDLRQGIAIVSGRSYLVSFDLVDSNNVGVSVFFTSVASSPATDLRGSGFKSVVLFNPAANARIHFDNNSNTFNGSIDNVSVKELRPEEEWV